ncbi:MAG: Fe-S protein assembly co-chaperone HscB [Pseudomonadota bacterium]
MDFNKNHFDLFDLPATFALDGARLDQAYRDLQAEIHPDRFAHAGEAEQRLAMQWATRANEAYQTLKKPFERADYLLRLRGIEAMAAGNTAMPMDFLMAQMEWRERLAEAVAAQDMTALEGLERALRAEAALHQSRLADELDVQKDDAAAAATLRKLRFTEKLLADVAGAYDDLA